MSWTEILQYAIILNEISSIVLTLLWFKTGDRCYVHLATLLLGWAIFLRIGL